MTATELMEKERQYINLVFDAKNKFPESITYRGKLPEWMDKYCDIRCSAVYMDGTSMYSIRYKLDSLIEEYEKGSQSDFWKKINGEMKKTWIKILGVCTPGGDPAYECPVCGKGSHVYGIESLEPHERCRDCGTELVYPWEVE